jgi:putative cardiolipin synthase
MRHFLSCILVASYLGGCASLPPGSAYPKTPSSALAESDATKVGRQFAVAAHEHAEKSGYRIISIGVDGFLMRMEMIEAAERPARHPWQRFEVKILSLLPLDSEL